MIWEQEGNWAQKHMIKRMENASTNCAKMVQSMLRSGAKIGDVRNDKIMVPSDQGKRTN
jgi:hypothetical protein